MSETIAKPVAQATRIAIQTMVETQSRIAEKQRGSKLGGPTLKQPQGNWEVADTRTQQNCHGKKLVRQKGVALYRKYN